MSSFIKGKKSQPSDKGKIFLNRVFTVLILFAFVFLLSQQVFGEEKKFQPPEGEKLKKILADFEKYTEKGMKERGIPGLAVAIVRDNEIIYAKGFGVRKIGSNDPVNEHTIFQIGSTSKAFTSALVAMMVDKGKVCWNDRVIDHLPDFRMYDSWVTRQFLLKDLMAQHSGMPAYSGDAQSFFGFDREHIIHSIRYIKPVTSFRSEFAYQNNLFLVAAKLVEKTTGKTWEENVQERILTPLGMTETTMDSKSFKNAGNVAFLHVKTDKGVEALPMNWDGMEWSYIYGPAGGLNSNLVDMSKWLRMQMHDGKFEGKQIVSEKNLDFVHSPQTCAPGHKNMPRQYYCEAWVYRENNPYPIIWHNGGTTGHNTVVALVPRAKIGIVAFANMTDSNALPDMLAYKFFDMYFGNPPRDWNAEAMAANREAEKMAKENAPKRPEKPIPARASGSYAGEYENNMYGKINLSVKNGVLCVTLGPGKMEASLKHWDGDIFELEPGEGLKDVAGFVTFKVDPSGKAKGIKIDMLNTDGCGVFRRVEDKK